MANVAMGVQLEGWEELRSRLDRLGHRGMENALRQAMRRVMVTELQEPVRKETPVDTGSLKKEMHTEISMYYEKVTGRFGTKKGDVIMVTDKSVKRFTERYEFQRAIGMIHPQLKEPDKYGYIREQKKPFMEPVFQARREAIARTFHWEVEKSIAARE